MRRPKKNKAKPRGARPIIAGDSGMRGLKRNELGLRRLGRGSGFIDDRAGIGHLRSLRRARINVSAKARLRRGEPSTGSKSCAENVLLPLLAAPQNPGLYRNDIGSIGFDIHHPAGPILMPFSTPIAIAIFLTIWFTVLFAVLPFGVRSQHEDGDVVAGSDPGAPVTPRLLVKALWTTAISAAIFAALVFFLQ